MSNYGRKALDLIPAVCDICGAIEKFASVGNISQGIAAYRQYTCGRVMIADGSVGACPHEARILRDKIATLTAERDRLAAVVAELATTAKHCDLCAFKHIHHTFSSEWCEDCAIGEDGPKFELADDAYSKALADHDRRVLEEFAEFVLTSSETLDMHKWVRTFLRDKEVQL